MSLNVALKAVAEGTEIAIHIQPGASTSEIVGLHGDALKVRIRARPIEGAANAALLAFLADRLGLPQRDVRLIRGDLSRRKTVLVALGQDETARRLTG